MDKRIMTDELIAIYEREIINLRQEMSIVAKKGFHNYADSIYARIYELEQTLKSKKILY